VCTLVVGSPGKIREFGIVRGSQGNYGLPVAYYRSFNSPEIIITQVLLSKVDMFKMDCK